MIQGGDPEGTGMGGPGYTIEDEFGHGHSNKRGFVSMANTGRPHSGGSQFFINTVDNGYLDKENPSTPYAHPVFGECADEKSYEVVVKISMVPRNRADKPLSDVVIEKAEVVE
jgi:peptidylprolyl isomerase